jgi:hypothetical protein
MPTVLEVDGFRFYFYANEGTAPPHVHVDKGGATAKVWLASGEWAHGHLYTSAQQRAIRRIVTEHQTELMERWNEFFGR